ncbi:MAG: nucleoside diphosphate kinase regulator [Paracoccaceae bacterium]
MNTTPTTERVRLPKVILDKTLINRLESMASSMMRRSPTLAERMMEELARAKLVAPEKLRSNIVTIGSAVTYRDLTSDRIRTVVLCYPEDEDIDQNRISVLTPVGVALLGLSAGATIPWLTRDDETRTLEVLTVSPPSTV